MVHELLNGLSPAEAEQVLTLGSRLILPSGTSLFQLGDPADRLFLVERGRIKLTLPMRVRGQEEDVFVEERGPGQAVGWSALIPPYRFTLAATAETHDAELIALQRDALLKYFASNPAAGNKIALNLAIVIGHRLQMFQTMWLREMQRTVEVRSA
ncbi:MAG TPA: cyclic nucleotide-binding domain-containing protein [Terriglobales bacterium]|nr:cyclic nucleotide-binding domain-containing protein [Terriglobales bacterium]